MIKTKSDEKLRWKVITTNSLLIGKQETKVFLLLNWWGKQNQKKEYQTIRNEHIIHFDITEQSAMKTDETHRKYLE